MTTTTLTDALSLRGDTRSYGEVRALDGLDLQIRSGEIVVDDSSDDTVKPTVSENTTVDYQV